MAKTVVIPQKPVNYWDIGFKLFWTTVSFALGYLIQIVADIPAWWAPLLGLAANAALAWIRQRYGTTAPDLPRPS